MSRSLTSAAVMYAVAAPAASAQAAARPNYTGTWVLDVSKSASSPGSVPTAISWNIQQHGDTLIADRETTVPDGTVIKSHFVIGVDGKAWKNTVPQPGMGDIETSTTASWETAGVVIKTAGNVQGTDFVQVDQWTLSADGKSLVSHRSILVQDQEVQSSTFTFSRKG